MIKFEWLFQYCTTQCTTLLYLVMQMRLAVERPPILIKKIAVPIASMASGKRFEGLDLLLIG